METVSVGKFSSTVIEIELPVLSIWHVCLGTVKMLIDSGKDV